MPHIADWLAQYAKDGVVVALFAVIAWLVAQWKKAEESKSTAEKNRADADQKAWDAERKASELRNEMPSIVFERFEKVEEYLNKKIVALRERIENVQIKIRAFEHELNNLKAQSALKDDDHRRFRDELQNMEEEVAEVSGYLEVVRTKAEGVRDVLEKLSTGVWDIELIEAAENKLLKDLRLGAASKTTVRVVERHKAQMTATAASTLAKFAEMERRLEMIERKAEAAHKLAVPIDAKDERSRDR